MPTMEASGSFATAIAGTAVHGKRNQLRSACSDGESHAATSRTASTTTWCMAATGRGESGADRNEGGGALPDWQLAPGKRAVDPAAADRCTVRRAMRLVRISTRSSQERSCEADEFYATVIPQRSFRGCAERDAPGASPACCGRSSSTTTSCATGWRAIPRSPPPPEERKHGPQSRLDAPLQRRRHLHARQVGVSRGTPPGTWPFTACRSRWSIRTSPRSSSS